MKVEGSWGFLGILMQGSEAVEGAFGVFGFGGLGFAGLGV